MSVLEVRLFQTRALVSGEEAGVVLQEGITTLLPTAQVNPVSLGVSDLNWALCVLKVQHDLSPVLQTLHTDFNRSCMDGLSTVG